MLFVYRFVFPSSLFWLPLEHMSGWLLSDNGLWKIVSFRHVAGILFSNPYLIDMCSLSWVGKALFLFESIISIGIRINSVLGNVHHILRSADNPYE